MILWCTRGSGTGKEKEKNEKEKSTKKGSVINPPSGLGANSSSGWLGGAKEGQHKKKKVSGSQWRTRNRR
jgi:hypothetical protein